MLVSFVIKNFGPFKDEAILTLTAQDGSDHSGNYIETEAAGKILTCIAIFGPNAAGKTYLFEALDQLRCMALYPAPLNEPIPAYFPFKLSKETKNAPTEMNIRFISEMVLYDYFVSFNSEKILEESLFYYPRKKRTEVFTRDQNVLRFKRTSKKREMISNIVIPNIPSIFTAAIMKDDVCRKAQKWFREGLITIGGKHDEELIEFLMKAMCDDEVFKKSVINAMNIADFAVSDIQYAVGEKAGLSEGEIEVFIVHDIRGDDLTEEDKRFPLRTESAGMIRFLSNIGPIIDALAEGRTVVIEEFGQNFHSELGKAVVEMFGDTMCNRGGGQLIFNSHNVRLMDEDVLRGDQIYLVNRNESGESELFSISDFAEKEDKGLLARYMIGKYGALPFIDKGINIWK